MYFGISVFPHKSVQDFANSYRKRYDPHYRLIPPHITLKEKFSAEEADLEEIVNKLEAVATKTSPFTISFNKVSHFHPTSPTIYLVPDYSEPLIELHQKIADRFDPVDSPYDFIPHLTIGQKMLEDELHDVYASARMTKFELETKIDRFHLLYQLEDGTWSVYQSFLLEEK
ncbi:2'-5' RNA ligase family protein [Hazenella coriacea]|uniref:Putative phosphoesterase EDD58_103101 n=1 Tax=Hazenella coriacea TaxID=1179467 RepID=A0A4R3L6N3_9BACL|nr:2'-5' RNA ligase family protein [Hazenella coriacea]TCS94685.1 2'-5' RNA ligase [Hazenella coriacea]